MAKGSRGGKRVTASTGGGGGGGNMGGPAPQVTPPTPQQIAQGNTLPTGGVSYDSFKKMTNDEKAQVITDALKVATPIFLDDSDLQKFAYYTGMNDKPNVVPDKQLDSMSGVDIYRTVNDTYNPNTDIGYTARDIAKQIMEGDFTMYSDSGGSAYGKAIYFADGYRESSWYGVNGRNPVTMRAKITNGKTITTSSLSRQYNRALRNGDALAVACSRADYQSKEALYALAKGYDAIIDNGYSGYNMILNRGCLTMSDKVKKTKIGGSSW